MNNYFNIVINGHVTSITVSDIIAIAALLLSVGQLFYSIWTSRTRIRINLVRSNLGYLLDATTAYKYTEVEDLNNVEITELSNVALVVFNLLVTNKSSRAIAINYVELANSKRSEMCKLSKTYITTRNSTVIELNGDTSTNKVVDYSTTFPVNLGPKQACVLSVMFNFELPFDFDCLIVQTGQRKFKNKELGKNLYNLFIEKTGQINNEVSDTHKL